MKSEWLYPLSERLSDEEIKMAQAIINYAVASFLLRLSFGQNPDFESEIKDAFRDWKLENVQWCSPPASEDDS